ncbi:MAG: hypothetical protein KME20_16660 [Kaiparowitsia implicata GSE-PSE-MK54-09C]|nr:hypothetical protein [Kaiparowitsia implicata GSE-PSE-MK54-09C]
MQYSLASRFRGAVLGALLGDALAARRSPTPYFSTCLGDRLQTTAAALGSAPWLPPRLSARAERDAPVQQIEGGTIASLPLILLHHDTPANLAPALQGGVDSQLVAPASYDNALLLAHTLALVLCDVAPSQMLSLLMQQPVLAPVFPALQQIQRLLAEFVSPAIAQPQLLASSPEASAMLLALYRFLAAPEELRLLLRSAPPADLSDSAPESTAESIAAESITAESITAESIILVGCLAGTHHAEAQVQLFRHRLSYGRTWGNGQEAENAAAPFFQHIAMAFDAGTSLADYLFAQWAGVYRPEVRPQPAMALTVAAANRLRPR